MLLFAHEKQTHTCELWTQGVLLGGSTELSEHQYPTNILNRLCSVESLRKTALTAHAQTGLSKTFIHRLDNSR